MSGSVAHVRTYTVHQKWVCVHQLWTPSIFALPESLDKTCNHSCALCGECALMCVCVRVCTCVHVHNTAPTPGFTSGYRGDSWTDPERFNQVSHIITHAYKFFLVRRSTAYIRYTWQPLNTGVQYKGSDPLSRSMITLLRMTAWLNGETCKGVQQFTQCWHCKLHRWSQYGACATTSLRLGCPLWLSTVAIYTRNTGTV